MEILFLLAILILSIVIHEVSHGYMANFLGDPTARLAGRLTLNPIPHIDALGSVIIPGLLLFSGSPFLFGWAKPVPYNPYNLSNQRWGEGLVAAAGPGINIIIAIIFGLLIRFREVLGFSPELVSVAVIVVLINVVLAIVNLIPIPPIDGSKILRSLLPFHLGESIFQPLEALTYRLGPFALVGVLLLIIFVLGPFISQAVFAVVGLLTGLDFGQVAQILQNTL